MTRKFLLTGAAVLAISAGAAFILVHPGQADRPVPAALAPTQAIGIGALGRVEPASRVRKLNQAGGMNVTRLGRLLVQEGDRVIAGQLVAEFSDTTQKDAA